MPLKPLSPPYLALAGELPPVQPYAEWFGSVDQLLRSKAGFIDPSVASDTNAAGHALDPANFLAGILLRSGPAGAFSDTTPSAADLVKNIPRGAVNTARLILIGNSGGGLMTLLAGTGITLAGTTTIAAGSGRFYLVTLTNITPGGETASLRGLITGTM